MSDSIVLGSASAHGVSRGDRKHCTTGEVPEAGERPEGRRIAPRDIPVRSDRAVRPTGLVENRGDGPDGSRGADRALPTLRPKPSLDGLKLRLGLFIT